MQDIQLQTQGPSEVKTTGWGKSERKARPRYPHRPRLNAGNGCGAGRQTPREWEGRRSSPHSTGRAWEDGHSGGLAGTVGGWRAKWGDPLARAAVWPQAHVHIGHTWPWDSPALPTIRQTAQISEPPPRGVRTPRGDSPRLRFIPNAHIWGFLNGRRPGGPPVDKQHSVGELGGSRPAPSTHRSHPSGSPTQPSPARGDRPC